MSDSTQFDRFDESEAAAEAIAKLIAMAGRDVAVHTRNLEPSIWENPIVISALRAYLTDGAQCNIRILIDEPSALNTGNTRFMAIAQRLSSHVTLRTPDPEEEQLDHEVVVTDRGGVMKWDLTTRNRGEFAFESRARAQQILIQFNRVWDRARACTELRALGI